MENNGSVVRQDMPLGELGAVFARSGYFSDAREAAQAIVKVLAGRELGFGPIASMTGIHIIKGKMAPSANIIAAAVKRSGRYDYKVALLDAEQCRLNFFDNGEPCGESSFSMEDARAAGVLSNPTWKQYARNMLFARAMSNGARWYCPDVFGGPVYTPEELGEEVDEEGNPQQAQAAEVIPCAETAPALAAPETPPASRRRSKFTAPPTPLADDPMARSEPDVDAAIEERVVEVAEAMGFATEDVTDALKGRRVAALGHAKAADYLTAMKTRATVLGQIAAHFDKPTVDDPHAAALGYLAEMAADNYQGKPLRAPTQAWRNWLGELKAAAKKKEVTNDDTADF